jgi:hypothetical protein
MRNGIAKLAWNHHPTSDTAQRADRLFALLLVTAALLAAGCASSGPARNADQVGTGIAEFRQIVLEARNALDATLRCLGDVAEEADRNPRPAFKRFDEALHRLEVVSIKARARADAMRARGNAYFEEWEEDLAGTNDEQARRAALERRARLRECFEEIRKSSQQAREEFRPFLSNLRDLRIVLGNNLTLIGIDSARTLIAQTRSDGQRVKRALDGVLGELNSVSATLAAVGVPKQP